MTHVSILVPSGSAVLESVVSVFTILDSANDHAVARGGDAVFDVHLVGATNHVDLYGGRFSVRPDLRPAESGSTGLVIVPALAGNIAEGLRHNAAFIPWIREQYHAGAEIAGLCSAALFIADTGLVGDEHCSPHWFVDAGFRTEFSHISLLVDRNAPDERAISGTGAYSFFQRVLQRAAGEEVASVCAASSETIFNRQCQSVLTISDVRTRDRQDAATQSRSGAKTAPARMTMGQFASMFDRNGRRQTGVAGVDTIMSRNATSVNGATLRNLFRGVPAQARLRRRSH
jgi:transcriptional regulator GlxA family with amidase domain